MIIPTVLSQKNHRSAGQTLQQFCILSEQRAGLFPEAFKRGGQARAVDQVQIRFVREHHKLTVTGDLTGDGIPNQQAVSVFFL